MGRRFSSEEKVEEQQKGVEEVKRRSVVVVVVVIVMVVAPANGKLAPVVANSSSVSIVILQLTISMKAKQISLEQAFEELLADW